MVSFSLAGLTWSMNDLIQMMLYDQYEKVETYDLKIILDRPLEQDQVYGELSRFPGMKSLEPMAEIPVLLKNQWLEKDVVLLGIPAGGKHYNILDASYRKMAPPREGILLSERLAKLLNAGPGTWLQLESPFLPNNEETRTVRVAGVIPRYLGINAYMEMGALQDFLNQGRLATSFTAQMDPSSFSSFKDRYRDSAMISEIYDSEELINKTRELMDSFGSMIYIYALIGIILGFSMWMSHFWYLPVGLVLMLILVIYTLAKNKNTKAKLDAFRLKLPLFGDIWKKSVLARTFRTFAALVQAGVPILSALEMTADVSGNAVVEDAFAQLSDQAKRGMSMGETAKKIKVIPPLAAHMIAIGEQTGRLEDMVDKVADWFEFELDEKIKRLTSIIEPVLIVFVGGVVALVVFAVFMPIIGSIQGLLAGA